MYYLYYACNMLFEADILHLKGNIIQVPLFSVNFDFFVAQWLILDTDLKWKTSLHYCLIAGNIFLIKEQIHFYEECKIVFPEKNRKVLLTQAQIGAIS